MNVGELKALLQSLPDDLEISILENGSDDNLYDYRFCVTDLAYDRSDDDIHLLTLAYRLPGDQQSLDCISISDYLSGKQPKRRPDS